MSIIYSINFVKPKRIYATISWEFDRTFSLLSGYHHMKLTQDIAIAINNLTYIDTVTG